MTTRRTVAAASAFAACAALALSACSQPSAINQSGSTPQSATGSGVDGQLEVMTAFYPLQYLTTQIGGDLVEAKTLTPPGAEPHDLELSPAKITEMSKSDVVLYLSGFQTAVDDAVAQHAPKTVIDVAPAVQLVDSSEHGDDGHDHGAESGHDHEAESGHDHAAEATSGTDAAADADAGVGIGKDPHFWLDPNRMAAAATVVGQGLAKADPKHAQDYTTNASTLSKKLKELATQMVTGTKDCAHDTFVVTHAAFGYLADLTDLKQVSLSGIDPDSDPSPARLREVADEVKKTGIDTIFTETLLDPRTADTLAKDLGIKTAVLDPIESQSDEAVDYYGAQEKNLSALRGALTCK